MALLQKETCNLRRLMQAFYASLPPCIAVFVFLLYRNSSMYRFNSHSNSCRSNKTQRAFSDSRCAARIAACAFRLPKTAI